MPLELPDRDPTVYWYLGTDNLFARGGQGTTDLAAAVELVARTNAYAPYGQGEEAIFTNVYLLLRRQADDVLTLELTPIVDGEELDPISIELAAAAFPVRERLEVGLARYYPSAADPQIATALRGTWFECELRSSGAIPAGRLEIEGIVLEHEACTESEEAVNAS